MKSLLDNEVLEELGAKQGQDTASAANALDTENNLLQDLGEVSWEFPDDFDWFSGTGFLEGEVDGVGVLPLDSGNPVAWESFDFFDPLFEDELLLTVDRDVLPEPNHKRGREDENEDPAKSLGEPSKRDKVEAWVKAQHSSLFVPLPLCQPSGNAMLQAAETMLDFTLDSEDLPSFFNPNNK